MDLQKIEPKLLYISIIDEYYINGFNRVKAVRAVKGQDHNYNSALSLFNRAYNHDTTAGYIEQKRAHLKRVTKIENENILRELINWAYSDIGDYLTLTPAEIKELPSEIRRCIQSFVYKTKKYINRFDEEVTEETLTLKLIDKTKAFEMINKHVDFYLAHNKSKPAAINIKYLTVETLNALLIAADTPLNNVEPESIDKP